MAPYPTYHLYVLAELRYTSTEFSSYYTIPAVSLLVIRAFLRNIHFGPDTRTSTAEFWLIPGAGNEDLRRNLAGRDGGRISRSMPMHRRWM